MNRSVVEKTRENKTGLDEIRKINLARFESRLIGLCKLDLAEKKSKNNAKQSFKLVMHENCCIHT